MTKMNIYCTSEGCEKEVQARLTNGAECYPHRNDLSDIPFWICDTCNQFVGCHHKHHHEHLRTMPMGCIATKEIKAARRHIHALIDPICKGKNAPTPRAVFYRRLSERLGYVYHTGEIRSVDQARTVYRTAALLIKDIEGENK